MTTIALSLLRRQLSVFDHHQDARSQAFTWSRIGDIHRAIQLLETALAAAERMQLPEADGIRRLLGEIR